MPAMNWPTALFFGTWPPDQGPAHRAARVGEAGMLVAVMVLAALLPYGDVSTSREFGLFGGLLFVAVRMIALRRWDMPRTPLDVPLAVLVALALISLFSAVDPAYSWREIQGELIRTVLIFYLVVYAVRTPVRALWVFGALLAGDLVMVGYGLIEYFIHGGAVIRFDYQIFSLHASAPELWTYLIQVGPFLAAAVWWTRRRAVRWPLVLFLAAHVLAVYFTFGRAACGVVIIEAAMMLYFAGRPAKALLPALVALMVALALFFPRPTVYLSEGEAKRQAMEAAGVDDSYRLHAWKTALNHIAEHPILGAGYGRRSLLKARPQMDDHHIYLWHAHNTFLTVGVSLGLPGLIVFLFIIYRVYRWFWPPGGPDPDLIRAVRTAVVVMVTGFFVSNLTNDVYINDAAQLFWLLTGAGGSLLVYGASLEQCSKKE